MNEPLRLLTFLPPDERTPRIGVKTGAGVVDVARAASEAGRPLSFDASRMLSLIEAGPAALDEVRSLLVGAPALPLEAVTLLAPIPRPPRNVFCVGWNYVEHFEEGKSLRAPGQGQELPEHPVFFTKATTAVNAPYGTIPYDPRVSTLIDWETELAVVIGRRGRSIPEERAMEHVFGFTILNDTTARDVQQKRHGGQWFRGKSLDGHAPTGPWIVTADGFDATDLRLTTRVNGVVKQEGRTSQMYFKVPRILAELSLGLTLEPGDVIATGTPLGIGHARKPPEYLKPGDVMESEIEGIGLLRNPIAAE